MIRKAFLNHLLAAAMLIIAVQPLLAQKRALTIDDIMEWQRITHRAITNDGQYSLIATASRSPSRPDIFSSRRTRPKP